MGIIVERHPKCAVLRLSGVLDVKEARDLRDVLKTIEAEGVVTVIFDMGDVRFASSTAIGAMVAFSNEHQRHYGNGSVMICGLDKSIKRALEVLGLLDTFVEVSSLSDALELAGDFGGERDGAQR
ncbi:MAG: hypothetical protein DRP63_03970 [Planctomycetota bacterium]|nr:MAG: hypothetical protein DRP63_03970 [Planctomycetota bacterium]